MDLTIGAIIFGILAAIAAVFGYRGKVKAETKAEAAKVDATVKVATVQKAAEKEIETVKGANDGQNEVAKLDTAAVADKLRDDWTRN